MESNDAQLFTYLASQQTPRDRQESSPPKPPLESHPGESACCAPTGAARATASLRAARRPTFIASSDLGTALYAIGLEAVVGVDPLESRHGRPACSVRAHVDWDDASGLAAAPGPRGSAPGAAAGSAAVLFVTLQLFHLGTALTPLVQSSPSFPTPKPTRGEWGAESAAGSATPIPHHSFEEVLTLPVTVADLPLDCELRCNVYDSAQGHVAACSLNPFSLAGELKGGYQCVPLTPVVARHRHGATSAPPPPPPVSSQTRRECLHVPSWELRARALHRGALPSVPWLDAVTADCISVLRQKRLDGMCAGDGDRARHGSTLNDEASTPDAHPASAGELGTAAVRQRSRAPSFLCLQLPVPQRAQPLVFLSNAMDALTAPRGLPPAAISPTASLHTMAAAAAVYEPTVAMPYVDHYLCFKHRNLSEAAAAVTAKSAFVRYDPTATPSVRERQRLTELAELPPVQLAPPRLEDVALMWRYRHFLTRDTRLFVPFMRTVAWRTATADDAAVAGAPPSAAASQRPLPSATRVSSVEVRAACELILRWKPLSFAQVLGCLSREFRGVAPVRLHATRLLDREDDAQLCWVALQLVQALRFDSPEEPELARFLVQRAVRHWELCCALYWGAAVEGGLEERMSGAAGEPTSRGHGGAPPREQVATAKTTPSASERARVLPPPPTSPLPITAFLGALEAALQKSQPLFLRRLQLQRELRGCLAALDTTLRSVPGDRTSRIIFGQRLVEKKACGFAELFARRTLKAVAAPIDGSGRSGSVSSHTSATEAAGANGVEGGSGSTPVRGHAAAAPSAATAAPAAPLRSLALTPLDAPGTVTLPTHPSVTVWGVRHTSFFVFKSAKQPLQVGLTGSMARCATGAAKPIAIPLAFSMSGARGSAPGVADGRQTAGGDNDDSDGDSDAHEVRLMLKVNDDVRQDQLVAQLVHWADSLLRMDGLDLFLTPYRVLATGAMEGLVEVVPDVVTFQSVQRDALRYLRTHNSATPADMQRAMDRYVRSLAGYSVFTFVLGIGDRHLENILLHKDGRLLHIDFGYILGNDPKPFSPPMKISREMLEVLGGPESDRFTDFKTYCSLAFNILRKHALLLMSLLLLMSNAERLPQLTGTADMDGSTTTGAAAALPFDPRTPILKVQERLRLDLSNAQASQYIQAVIADSVGSLFTGLWDVLHAAAQATRV